MLEIRGAREHNLKNIDVDIPKHQLVVITGLSGSGKSSLAFDTIYAEGQRRYVESLSAYARQFLGMQQKPDVDRITGLSPAISIEQKSTNRNPRSTVGTLTEIYDYLRLLYARVGEPHCPHCNIPIAAQTVQQMVDTMMGWPEGTKCLLMAPLVEGRKGEYKKELQKLIVEGFTRVRIDGEVMALDQDITLDKKRKHTIELVIDRFIIRAHQRQRLTESVELALKKGQGLIKVAWVDGPTHLFSERFSCPQCQQSIAEISPRLFSFNSPQGACVDCDGLGERMAFDASKIVPEKTLSLGSGAIAPWAGRMGGFYQAQLRALARQYKQSMQTPWHKLPKAFQQVVLFGTGEAITVSLAEGHMTWERNYEGVIPQLTRRWKESDSDKVRADLEPYMVKSPCPSCKGDRLKPEALAVWIAGVSIAELTRMPLAKALAFCQGLPLSRQARAIADRLLQEITNRMEFLVAVGLAYLSLHRSAATLSGGEAQRIRLATQIGSALQGVIYVLDEPSIGLHQRDNARLLQTLCALRDIGNSVLVVEHDEDTILAADYVIDMGPGAGALGGHVVASGTPQQIMDHPKSLTGAYLSGRQAIAVPTQRRVGHGKQLRLQGATGNNLQNVAIEVPLGCFVAVTGVSGSGKSTLINETLFKALSCHLAASQESPAPYKRLQGVEHVDKIIAIDQSPIGRTPRSNPATYTQLFTLIRDLFSQLPASKQRGYAPGRYSFNVKGGRCEACQGDGILRIEMNFLADVFVTCETCQGKRYNRETLEITYKGKNIADVLALTVDEATEFLGNIPSIRRKCEVLQQVGLGYVQLGQSATTFSGGEAQRMKLAKELSRRSTGKTIYLLDEPTTGLHFADVDKLLAVLHHLVDGGNTVLVIEHNLDVIKTADYVIDLGPEGGAGGGQIVATGTPEDIVACAASYTGQFLKALLKR